MRDVPEFREGQALKAEDLNKLRAAIIARTPQNGKNTRVVMSSQGFSIHAKGEGEGGGGALGIAPGFQLKITTDPEDESEDPPQKIQVTPSVVNGLDQSYVPVDGNGDRLDLDPPPLFDVAASSTVTFYLRIEIEPHAVQLFNITPPAYVISNSSFTVVNSQVLVTTTEENQWAEIDPTSGAVNQNHVVTWPLGEVTADDEGKLTIDTVPQFNYGPITAQWADGRLAPVPPAYYGRVDAVAAP